MESKNGFDVSSFVAADCQAGKEGIDTQADAYQDIRYNCFYHDRLLICGNNKTSRMESVWVRSIISRSIPIPIPPVGGMPYSSASMKSTSISEASSFPSSFSFNWARNRSRWSIGSFNSVKALAYSRLLMKSSNRSVKRGSWAFFLASGEISIG